MDSNPLQIEYDSSTQTLTLTTPMNHQVIIRESSAIHSLSKTPTKTSSPLILREFHLRAKEI